MILPLGQYSTLAHHTSNDGWGDIRVPRCYQYSHAPLARTGMDLDSDGRSHATFYSEGFISTTTNTPAVTFIAGLRGNTKEGWFNLMRPRIGANPRQLFSIDLRKTDECDQQLLIDALQAAIEDGTNQPTAVTLSGVTLLDKEILLQFTGSKKLCLRIPAR